MRPFKMKKNALLHKIKSTQNVIGTFNFFKHYSKLLETFSDKGTCFLGSLAIGD
jgi:hypothetical protein